MLHVFEENNMASNMASNISKNEPSNTDIMKCLKNIESTMKGMEKRLSSLEAVEKKVTEFESELKKIWIYISDTNKATIERVGKVEERVETTDFSLSLANSKVLELEKEKDSLKDEIVYLQSHSMRNNLVFSNIPEAPLEGPDVAEAR
jgi:chromosome segregation ATPase